MSTFDSRLIQVGIQIGDGIQYFGEGYYITAQGTKYGNPSPNECQVRIDNLTAAHRNQILTDSSPWSPSLGTKKLILKAGRASYGASLIFNGNITIAGVSQPPDIGIIVNAIQGIDAALQTIAVSMPARTSLKTIAQTAANQSGLNLDFQATDKQISNYNLTGSIKDHMNKMELSGNYDVLQNNDSLVIKDKDVPVKNRVKKLSLNSGMIGTPEITELGIRVKMLLDNETEIGGQIDLTSKLNPALNGSYVIQKLGFDIASRDIPFYWIAEAKRIQL